VLQVEVSNTPSSREKDRTKLNKIKRSIVASSLAPVFDFQEKILSWCILGCILGEKRCVKNAVKNDLSMSDAKGKREGKERER